MFFLFKAKLLCDQKPLDVNILSRIILVTNSLILKLATQLGASKGDGGFITRLFKQQFRAQDQLLMRIYGQFLKHFGRGLEVPQGEFV